MSHSPTTSSQAPNGAFTPPRRRPRVIAVRPVSGPVAEPLERAWLVSLGVLVCSGIAMFIAALSSPSPCAGLLDYPGILALFVTARFTRDWTDSRRRIKPAELLAESVPDATKDRASVALQQMARERRNLPSDSALLLEAQRNQPLDDEVATVALLGVDRMPVIRNVVFEPYILSQSQRFGTRWLWVGVGALLFILNAHVAATSAWSSPASTAVRPTNVAPLFFLVVLGSALVLGAIIWFVGVLLEPEYVRILPGEIQYVRFSAGARGRLDRAYPMTAGTTAILREEFGRITLTLLRGGQRDVLNISALWDQYTALERIWQSLLTTAPTPALTDKELLG